MAESDRRQLISSTPHLTPEEVAKRSFATSFRGLLRGRGARVPEARLRGAASARATARRSCSTRSTRSRSSCGRRGRSTSRSCSTRSARRRRRLLRSAREAGDDIRTQGRGARGPASSTRPRAEAERARAEADEYVRRAPTRPRSARRDRGEAEQHAAEIDAAVEAYSTEQRQRAERETERADRSRARQQGREMLDEAKATRERVLADLVPPARSAASADRRAARRARPPARRVPRREAHVPRSDRSARAGRSARAAERGDATRRRRAEAARRSTPTTRRRDRRRSTTMRSTSSGATRRRRDGRRRRATRPTPSLADVDSLFARIRAGPGRGRRAPTPRAADEAAEAAEAPPAEAAELAETAGRRRRSPSPSRGAAGAAESGRRVAGAAGRACSIRCSSSVAKRAKRAAQDDQNALLDAVRRHKGRPDRRRRCSCPSRTLLHGVGRACCATRSTTAYGAGRVAAGGERRAAPSDDSRDEVAAAIVLPLRERIAVAIDAGEEGDTGGLVERIGARFREWKNQSLEDALADVLAMCVVAWRLRRVARRRGAAVDPVGRGSLRRLRRQRPGTDGEGLDRSRPVSCIRPRTPAAAACSLRPMFSAPRSEHVNESTAASATPRSIRPVRVPRSRVVDVRSAFAAG